MKIKITIILIFTWINLFGQTDSVSYKPKPLQTPVDCEVVALNATDRLSKCLLDNNFESYDAIVNEWIKMCGFSEYTQRLIVLKSIIHHKSSANAIKTYFQFGFYIKYADRVYASKKANYGYEYSSDKAGYGYIPLRLPLDSIIVRKSAELLKTNSLTPDERLMCKLFLEDIDGFDKECKKPEYKGSFIQDFRKERLKEYTENMFWFGVNAGVYGSIGKEHVFGNNPLLGLTFGGKFKKNLSIDIALKMRLNYNDKPFDFIAFEDTNTVNSGMSIFMGGLFGYTLVDKNNFSIASKLGVGLESVNTGLSESDGPSPEDRESYDLNTIHLSLGFAVMVPVFEIHRIGLEITYHFCPYGANSKLLTKFDNSALSAEIFYRF